MPQQLVGGPQQPVKHTTPMDFFSMTKYSCSLTYMIAAAFTYWAGFPMLACVCVAIGLGVLLAPM